MTKSNIVVVFNDFFNIEKLSNGVNSSFLVLIPNIAGITCPFSKFRPIILINSIYKSISKCALYSVVHCFANSNHKEPASFFTWMKYFGILNACYWKYSYIGCYERKISNAKIGLLESIWSYLVGLLGVNDEEHILYSYLDYLESWMSIFCTCISLGKWKSNQSICYGKKGSPRGSIISFFVLDCSWMIKMSLR